MWAAWIADGRETTAEIRGAEDHDVRSKVGDFIENGKDREVHSLTGTPDRVP